MPNNHKVIIVSTHNVKKEFCLIVEGPTYGRRDDLYRLGFKFSKGQKYWFTPFDLKVLDIVESWPEVKLTAQAESLAERVREAQRKTDAQKKATGFRANITGV
jgi:ATP-dependent exoDNAse (exonuclease V) alpha subunit